MLKEITIENFCSFNEKQVFTMEALPPKSIKEHQEHLIQGDGCAYLRLASIYGPNGSGKSNLIKALSFLRSLLLSGVIDRRDPICKPFLGSDNKIVSLSYAFEDDNFETRLSFSFSLGKAKDESNLDVYPFMDIPAIADSPYRIEYEKFEYRKTGDDVYVTAYERSAQKILADALKKELGLTRNFAVPRGALLVFFVAREYADKGAISRAISSFVRQVFNLLPLDRSAVGSDLVTFIKDEANAKYLAAKLNEILGCNIKGFYFDEPKKKNIFAFRALDRNIRVIHKTGEKEYVLALTDESEGSRKLMSFIARIKKSHDNSIFYADDFDSHLHPALIRALLLYFGSEDSGKRQFIFNSHDILNMNSDLFRRDEIWFTVLDDKNATKIYSLSDLRGPDGRVIRNDQVYSKKYLEGKYGADPFIARGLKL